MNHSTTGCSLFPRKDLSDVLKIVQNVRNYFYSFSAKHVADSKTVHDKRPDIRSIHDRRDCRGSPTSAVPVRFRVEIAAALHLSSLQRARRDGKHSKENEKERV